ncbi:MAG: signal peptide peptidase SppA [Deferribacteraceae bacterium]|jgi:protease-4|nr:signal peptide peptidase SppA [Deferribacteraceae bacterium]
MKIIRKVFQILVILLMISLFIRGVVFIFDADTGAIDINKGDFIAVLEINGIIASADDFIGKMKELSEKTNLKGVLLRVNSPGGLVTPSQEIYEYLKTLKIPLYVSMGATAASGGYMVALPAKKIYAMPSTITGSIGVIMEIPNYKLLMDKIGITFKTIKSGEFKDTGNASRDMTEAEETYLRGIVMDMYSQFVQAVSDSRDISYEQAEEAANGKVYTGKAALALGLVDELGSWQEALEGLKTEIGDSKIKHMNIKYGEEEGWKKYLSQIPTLFGREEFPRPGFYFMMKF